jgi:hyperosmotically inducible periplasmic protein
MTNSGSAVPFDDLPPAATSDEIVKRLVVDELYWDSRVDASKVMVEVTDGVVILTGHTPTFADRVSAEADARLIRGVVSVENRIAVEHPKLVPDAELAHNVSTVLVWTPDVDASDITVTAREGTVTLTGSVRHYWEKLRAHLLAARVEGVLLVIDELTVTPVSSDSDHEIARRLTRALERRMPEELPLIQITVNAAQVILRGSVPNAALKRVAQRATERTAGVVGVTNELTFPHPEQSPQPQRSSGADPR